MIDTLYKEYRHPLLKYVRRKLRNYPSDFAEDIVQQTFLKAIERLPQDVENPLLWLERVANSLIFDDQRKWKNKHQKVDRGLVHDLYREKVPTPEDVLDQHKHVDLANDLLRDLGPTDRQIFILFYHHGLKYNRIAQMLGMTRAAIAMRLHHGKQRLYLKFRKAA